MAQAKDLNISPYYNDFDPNDDFYKVLFKPGFPVQARELTNIQSLLQNQIESFGSHIFKKDTNVSGGSPTCDINCYSVKLNSTQFGIPVSLYADKLINKVVEGQTSGVTATVDLIALPDGNNVEDLTIYVKYLNSGSSDPNRTEFIDGEILICKQSITYGNTTINAGTAVATLITNDATAIGSTASILDGIYYIRGYFVNVDKQTIILDHYTNTPSYRVGLQITEQIITCKDDPSLYDNAQGFTNYSAPGADRLKITLTLTKKPINDENIENFVEIMRIIDGVVVKTTKTEYNKIRDWIAGRTFDESGNYTVDTFNISTVDSLNNRLGNGGQYYSNQETQQGNTPSEDLMCVKVSGGKAYVKGYDVDIDRGFTIIDVKKPRTTAKIDDANIDFQLGNRLTLNNLRGQPQYRKEITFYDEVLNNSGGVTGNKIGQARVYSLSSQGSPYKDAASKWALHLYDIQIYTKLTLTTSVTTSEVPLTARIQGLSSGAIAYVVDGAEYVSGTSVRLNQVNGTFLPNEKISVNGVSKSLSIESVTSYKSQDIRSVKQSSDLSSGFAKDFTANIAFNSQPLPNGITQVRKSSTALFTTQGQLFTGIKVGDIIQYADSQSSDITYAKVAAGGVAANGKQLTITEMTQSVAGVYYGDDVGSDGFKNVTLAVGNILESSTSNNNNGLYEILPKPNISSVDFSKSSLTISAQITGQTVSGTASTVSTVDIHAGGGSVALGDAFFDSYAVNKYSIHYGSVTLDASTTGIGTVTGDSFNLLGNGDESQFTGLIEEDSNTLVNVTAKKTGVTSKIKNYEKSKLLSVTRSKLEESGTNEYSSNNDGLSYNKTAYGLRVQDEEISLNVPDVARIIAVYESVNGSIPTLDTISFNATVDVLSNANLGEDITGEKSGCIARVVTNNGSTPSSGGANKLGVVYLTNTRFEKNENVIFSETNIKTRIEGFNTNTVDGQYQNISNSFKLDGGQKDQYYDYSRLVRKSSSKIPSKQLLIIYDHYTVPVDDSGDVFTALSYSKSQYSNHIPLIGGRRIRATDTLDFRPRVSPWDSSSASKSPFAFSSRSFDNSPKLLMHPTGSSILGYEYYLGRIDKVYFNLSGEVGILEGQPADPPRSPTLLNDSMELASIALPPYLYNSRNAKITLVDNRRYTMRDIGVLEERIQNLEEVTTLSLLEVSTESLIIEDAEGNNRFKSGFFVDNYSTDSLIDPNSKINVDSANGEIHAEIARNSFNNKLMYNGSKLLDANVVKNSKAVTLAYDSVAWIEQSYATRVENVNPFHVIQYIGDIVLTPESDTWDRTIWMDPDINPIVTPITGRPVTNPTIILGTIQISEHDGSSSWERGSEMSGSISDERFESLGFTKNGNTWRRDIQPTTHVGDEIEVGRTVDPEVVVDSGDDEYMRSRNVYFICHNLKPLTRHYQFLDGHSGVGFVPKLVQIAADAELNTVGSNGVFEVGEIVEAYSTTADNAGSATQLPAGWFMVAPANHKLGDVDNPELVYDWNPYDNLPMPTEYTNSSPILNLDVLHLANDESTAGFLWTGCRLEGRNSKTTAYVKNHQLITDNYGDLLGSFWLQNPWTDPAPDVRIDVGRKEYKLTSSSENKKPLRGSTLISYGQTKYESKGTYTTMQSQTTINYEQVSTVHTGQEVIKEDYVDPVAQTFNVGGNVGDHEGGFERDAPDDSIDSANFNTVGDEDGAYITEVDLFFARKPGESELDDSDDDEGKNAPVTVQIRTVELGTPTRKLVSPDAFKTLRPSEVFTSDDASAVTKFKFDYPIYLAPYQEYAVVVLAPASTDYEVHIARMGEDAVNVQDLPNVGKIQYSEQWAMGSFFRSQNGSTWTPEQMEDLKMKLYKAKFTATSGTVYLSNPSIAEFTPDSIKTSLPENSIITLPKSGKIGITTLVSGSAGISTLTPGRRIVGSSRDYVTATIVGTGSSVTGVSGIVNGGSGYQSGTTTGPVETFNIIGEGSGYKLNNVEVTNGAVSGFGTANVGTGYTAGDIVGIKTSDMTGFVGSGARIVITDVDGIDTLYLSEIQGSNGSGSFKSSEPARYVDDLGVPKNVGSDIQYTSDLVVNAAPYDGKHMLINQYDHGMHQNNNKLNLGYIESNLESTTLESNMGTDSTESISVGSTSSPYFAKFEGVEVSASNPGYIIMNNEIIKYTAVSSTTLDNIERAIDNTTAGEHIVGDGKPLIYIQKYELNGVSLRRLNTDHIIASDSPITLNTYHIGFSADSTKGIDRSSDTTDFPELSFKNFGFFGGNKAKATRNIQFDRMALAFGQGVAGGLKTPGGGITGATALVRTVSGTSIDGSESSFIDQGYEPIGLTQINKFSTPRLVCSKENENAYLTNMPDNKSIITAITFSRNEDKPNLSPILFTDNIQTIFYSNSLNKPITDYTNNALVKSSLYDPHSAIYITNTIKIDKPADSLKVMFAAYRHSSSDIRVLYSLLRPDSPNSSDPEYTLFPGYDKIQGISTLNSSGEVVDNDYENSSRNTGNPDEFVPASIDGEYLDYEFTADNLGEFVGYSIKVVMSGTNQAETPRIKQFRAIAIK